MKRLDHLSRCYIFEENEYRQFGCVQNDWQRLVKFLQWDIVGIIVLNITRQKALCYRAGQTPEFADINSALFWLRSFPTALGIMQRSRGEEIEYAHVEVWWDPQEGLRTKAAKVLEKVLIRLTKTIVDRFSHVTFWRPA